MYGPCLNLNKLYEDTFQIIGQIEHGIDRRYRQKVQIEGIINIISYDNGNLHIQIKLLATKCILKNIWCLEFGFNIIQGKWEGESL